MQLKSVYSAEGVKFVKYGRHFCHFCGQNTTTPADSSGTLPAVIFRKYLETYSKNHSGESNVSADNFSSVIEVESA